MTPTETTTADKLLARITNESEDTNSAVLAYREFLEAAKIREGLSETVAPAPQGSGFQKGYEGVQAMAKALNRDKAKAA